jgi:hypothetical protein
MSFDEDSVAKLVHQLTVYQISFELCEFPHQVNHFESFFWCAENFQRLKWNTFEEKGKL